MEIAVNLAYEIQTEDQTLSSKVYILSLTLESLDVRLKIMQLNPRETVAMRMCVRPKSENSDNRMQDWSGDDHHSPSCLRGHGSALYQPTVGPLSSADN